MGLSPERKLLLKKGIENNGKLTTGMAEMLYANGSSARSALAALEFKGYIERDVPGVFRVVKAPADVKENAKMELEA